MKRYTNSKIENFSYLQWINLAIYSFTYLFIKVWVFANGRPWTFSSQSSLFLSPAQQQEKRQAVMYLIDSFRLVICTERPGLHFPLHLDSFREESKILSSIPLSPTVPHTVCGFGQTTLSSLTITVCFVVVFSSFWLAFSLSFPVIVILVLEIPLQRSPLSRTECFIPWAGSALPSMNLHVLGEKPTW